VPTGQEAGWRAAVGSIAAGPLSMTAFLASVCSLAEAREVADVVDVLDLKDPSRGALGMLDPHRVAAIARWADDRYVLSAALGEAPMSADDLRDACRTMDANGVDFVKLGLADGSARSTINALPQYVRSARMVGVLFADRHLDFEWLDDLARAGFAGAMLDTATKNGLTLLDVMSDERLEQFVSRTRALGMFAGLAGSLRSEQLPHVLGLAPDFVGVRGAICEGGARSSDVCRNNALAVARHFDPNARAQRRLKLHRSRSDRTASRGQSFQEMAR
jgi:dihydroneopterin aldolase